ncbi:MAG: DUF192 domain-containing protein [Roseovarius sp.]
MGNRRQTTRVIPALLALVLACAPVGARAQEACDEGAIHLRGDWGQARFSIAVADDEEERAQGLMFVETLATSAGMLFVYESERPVRFWMKNTLIPLDMIFADATGTVQRVHSRAEPGSERLIYGGDAIQYVLEINGGLAEQFGIAEGTLLRHPAIASEAAAWPCE